MLKAFFAVALTLVAVLPLCAQPNTVPGLELPKDQTVKSDEQFLIIEAKATGQVKFIVLGTVKVKYTATTPNTVTVGIPGTACQIGVYAVADIGGKLTDPARTTITVTGPSTGPGPLAPGAHLHITVIEDGNARTPAIAAVLNGDKLRAFVTQTKHSYRVLDQASPAVPKGILAAAHSVKALPALIVQTDDGRIRLAQALPATETELLAAISIASGSNP